MRTLCILVVCMLLPLSAFGDGHTELTLEQAVQTALQKNLTVREQRLLLEQAEAQIVAARGEFDPALKLAYQQTYSKEKPFSPLLSMEEETSGYSASMGGKVSLGTEYELKYSSQRVELSEDTLYLEQNPYYTSDLTLALRQPLLKGLGPEVQTAKVASARKTYEAARLAVSDRASEVALMTIEAYWDLFYARENLSVAKRSLELSRGLLDEVQNKIKAGALPHVEIYNAEAEVALREERLLLTQKAVRDAEDALRAHMDTEDWEQAIVPVTSPPAPQGEPLFDEALQHALESRWDYLQAQEDLQAKEIMAHFYANQKMPDLDLIASGGLSGLGEGQGEAYNEAQSTDYYSWMVGVELSIPIGNRAAKGSHHKAKSEADAARLRVERIRKTIVVELREAIRAVELSRQSIQATARTREAMEKRLEAARERFRLGMVTLNDVLRFEEEYAEASSNEVRALTGHAKAHAQLERVSGTMKHLPF